MKCYFYRARSASSLLFVIHTIPLIYFTNDFYSSIVFLTQNSDIFPTVLFSTIGLLDPFISHANYSLCIREVSSESEWIADPLHPGFSAGLYSYTRFFTHPGVHICTLPITEWELKYHSEAWEKWCTKRTLVEVPLVFPAFAHCMYTFSYFAEHYYTGSDQKSILSNMLQAFPRGVQCPGTFQYPPHRSQRHDRVAVQEEVTQCHPHWLRERQQISPNLTLGTWVWWCQVRVESLLSYSHSQSGMSRSQAPPLPCDHCWRAAPTKESSREWKNGECFIYLSIKS